MKYYKDNDSAVFAYDDEPLLQVSRLSELELLLNEKEPLFISARNDFELATLELEEAKELLAAVLANYMGEDEDASASIDEEIQRITLVVEDKTAKLDEVTIAFNQIESEYQPLKDEFDTVLPVFFDVREHLNVLKIMSAKEVEAYLNPPISKEQLIVEAEQQKQSLLAEANNAIAPLQYAIDLNMATDEEIAQLTVWKTYCVLLNRVDTSTVPNIEWPEKP